MNAARVSRIDYMLVTHYHADHVGGVAPLACASADWHVHRSRGHGRRQRRSRVYDVPGSAEEGKNVQATPGDTIPVAGLKVTVVASAGETIKTALPGAGQPNPLCAEYKPQPADSSENARSTGVVIAYGAFRMLDLGDLTWNIEHGLACPANLIGPVDLYLTTHHGNQQSGPPALVHAVRPRVAIQNNGADKGGAPSAWHIVRNSPGLQDLWQLHTANAGGHDANTADKFIANLNETTAHMIKVSAREDGSFTVTNTRTRLTEDVPSGGCPMTAPISVAELHGVYAVPPLPRNADARRTLNFDAAEAVAAHIQAGGITRYLYGGNAFLYHITLDEYEVAAGVAGRVSGAAMGDPERRPLVRPRDGPGAPRCAATRSAAR